MSLRATPGSSPRPSVTQADVAAAWAGLGNPGPADARDVCRGKRAGPLASGLLAQPRVIAVDGPPGTIEYLVPASMFVPVTYPAIKLRGWSLLNGPADASQVIAETEGRRLFAPCKVDAKLNLATEGNASPHEFGLAPLGVADCLREREDFSGACDWHNQHAVIIAEDQVLAAHRPISHGGGLQRILGSDVEALRAGWDRSQAEDRQADRPYVSCVAMEPPDNDSFQPSGLNL
jgi:hypothetical protein